MNRAAIDEDLPPGTISRLGARGISPETIAMLRTIPSIHEAPRATALRVYLDLNHWVSLAKAKVGRSDGQAFWSCYQRLARGVRNGDIVIPLSSAHYMELSKIRSLEQRIHLAEVMSELSGFVTLAGYGFRIRMELAAAFHTRFGRPASMSDQPILGRGAGFAFDLGDGFVSRMLSGTGWDWYPLKTGPGLTFAQSHQVEHLRTMLKEYLPLRGPSPEDIPQMPDYRPEVAQRGTERYVDREQALANELNQSPAQGEALEDIIHARYLYWDLQPALPQLLTRISMSMESFLAHDKDWVSALLDDLPTAVVHMGLTRQSFNNASRLWTPNDIRDIDALSGAVPNCDIVVTEKHAVDVLTRSDVARRFGTEVLRHLSELELRLDHGGESALAP